MLNISNEVRQWLLPTMNEDVNFLASYMAGKFVFAGTRKRFMHLWIMNRLQDSHGHVSPGAILKFIENAVKTALADGFKGDSENLFSLEELREALRKTSEQQARAIYRGCKEIGVLSDFIGCNAVITTKESLDKIKCYLEKYPDSLGSSMVADTVLRELIRQGIASSRYGMIDFADIYRYSFDMKRSK